VRYCYLTLNLNTSSVCFVSESGSTDPNALIATRLREGQNLILAQVVMRDRQGLSAAVKLMTYKTVTDQLTN
jgi:hypothetical protein